MHRKILSRRLTTCTVIKGGEAVCLDLINEAGYSVSLELSFEQAQSIVMTLPQLLSKALRARSGNTEARFVFPIGQWALEGTADGNFVIATLTTTDGFEASFGIPFATCQNLGSALECAGRTAIEEADAEDETTSAAANQIN